MPTIPAGVRIAGLLCSAMLLGSCSAPAPEQAQWTEPEWMAEQAQEREQFVLDLQACVTDRGWNVTVDEYAGVVEPFESREEAERYGSDSDDCLTALGQDVSRFDDGPTVEQLREHYQRELDVRDCLVHQGVRMQAEPPAEEQFVEQSLQGVDDGLGWWAYGDPGVTELGQAEVAQLQQHCPEPWVFAAP